MIALTRQADGFSLAVNGKTLIRHSADAPCIYVGVGRETIEMYRGNFDISDEIEERVPLRYFSLRDDAAELFSPDGKHRFTLRAFEENGRARVTGVYDDERCNRLWLRLFAQEGEDVYGAGEQFSYFALRGRKFPIWTSEQGVGRNKKTEITFLSDVQDRAGGDYWWTFFPESTFVSTRGYYAHFADSCYAVLDFTHPGFHEVHLWQNAFDLTVETGGDLKQTVSRLTGLLGRQNPLPDWAIEGVWLGVQGGCAAVDEKIDTMRAAGVRVSAVWCQDWSGVRMTSFGKRVRWNWRYSEELYPRLPEKIREWRQKGVRFLAYISPHLCADGDLFKEASAGGYLLKRADGGDCLVDFGEFDCGFIDFTNPDAVRWYRQLIIDNMIGIGCDGWMTDFSEYFPTDCVLHDGSDPMKMHNRWPALWAKLAHDAVREAGREKDIVFFMRAGAAGSQTDCPLMWAGDQNVDWSMDDGLASVIPAALSLGMTGHGLHTSDIGGYTTLFSMRRTRELLLRWCEFCAFTPVMRTHEGNRPAVNHQFDSDRATVDFFAWATRVHAALAPYLRALMDECRETGMPVMRATVLEYPDDPAARSRQYQYFLGRDMLVAPVYTEGADSVSVYVPEDGFVDLWTGAAVPAGETAREAPLGRPAALVRKDSVFDQVFTKISEIGAWSLDNRARVL